MLSSGIMQQRERVCQWYSSSVGTFAATSDTSCQHHLGLVLSRTHTDHDPRGPLHYSQPALTGGLITYWYKERIIKHNVEGENEQSFSIRFWSFFTTTYFNWGKPFVTESLRALDYPLTTLYDPYFKTQVFVLSAVVICC